ncbi:MAG TPA: thioredoxin family protein, partial [Phycisphaerales bacterium]|nr:thioredoxin family protein [Phycisphaerales bacterium]
ATATPRTGTPAPTSPSVSGPIVIDLGVFDWKVTLDGAVGYALLFLVAIAGGFILNLTPCVLPVIPLKILGLQAQAGTRSRMLYLGFVMFCGLVFFWLAIGVLLAVGVLNAISEISSYWQFNMLIAAFMAAMGLGMFGLFTVGLPTWVYNIDVKHDSVKGSFGFGIMSAILATPCVAPLVGGIAAGATKLPMAVGLLLFVFVGIGMGLPYLVLAAYPRLIAWLPRAGPGSELLKQVLGLLMIAVSFFFLGSALITLVAEYPWFAKQLHWWAIAVAILLATGWLILRTFQITPSAVKRVAFTLLGLLLTLGAFSWANTQTRIAETAWERAELARREREKLAPGVITDEIWQDYTPAKVETTLSEGKVVVMDFTAEWCAICKTLEASILHADDVEAALKSGGVRSFIVDLTSKKAEGWQRLYDLGQKGVPTLAIMGPGLKEPWVRNAYTIGEVVDAINQAKGDKATAARP